MAFYFDFYVAIIDWGWGWGGSTGKGSGERGGKMGEVLEVNKEMEKLRVVYIVYYGRYICKLLNWTWN